MLVGYYIQGQAGRPWASRPPAERQALALEQGGRIHPQYRDRVRDGIFRFVAPRDLEPRFVVVGFRADARKLISHRPRVYLAGDHMNLNAWMQGAFESARQTATAVHTRAVADRPTVRV